MKTLLMLLILSIAAESAAQAQQAPAAVVAAAAVAAPTAAAAPDPAKPLLVVDASCGQCRLGLPGKSCDLAVRLNGQAYFVDGTGIDSHGDAHAKDGLCQAIRQAQVQGELVDNRFRATYFQLLPPAAAGKQSAPATR